jgi:proline-specific peptidase
MKIEEGKIQVDGYAIWYRKVDKSGIPLLILHGGPGAGHEYLLPLEGLGRSVIFYDQLGCGKSDVPDDVSLWRMERFTNEIDQLRKALELDQIHLFGQSYGGWLAIEYLLTQPKGVLSSTLASTSASVSQYINEMNKLKAGLPVATYQMIKQYEAMQAFDHPQYQAAYFEFLKRHMCRLDSWPDVLVRTTANINNFPGYKIMWGSNEFEPSGNLKNWDRTGRLGEIRIPTLITVGKYDEMPAVCANTLQRGLADAQVVIFEESAHMPHLEETEKYLKIVADFLNKVERKLKVR